MIDQTHPLRQLSPSIRRPDGTHGDGEPENIYNPQVPHRARHPGMFKARINLYTRRQPHT